MAFVQIIEMTTTKVPEIEEASVRLGRAGRVAGRRVSRSRPAAMANSALPETAAFAEKLGVPGAGADLAELVTDPLRLTRTMSLQVTLLGRPCSGVSGGRSPYGLDQRGPLTWLSSTNVVLWLVAGSAHVRVMSELGGEYRVGRECGGGSSRVRRGFRRVGRQPSRGPRGYGHEIGQVVRQPGEVAEPTVRADGKPGEIGRRCTGSRGASHRPGGPDRGIRRCDRDLPRPGVAGHIPPHSPSAAVVHRTSALIGRNAVVRRDVSASGGAGPYRRPGAVLSLLRRESGHPRRYHRRRHRDRRRDGPLSIPGSKS